MLDSSAAARLRTLTTKLTASPVLPLLGWTKLVEASITTDAALPSWIAYTVVVTVLWVFADTLKTAAEDVAEE